MADRKDPYLNARFKVELDSSIEGGFIECAGFDVTTDVAEYREGIDPPTLRKQPGLTKYGNITLKWGLTDSKAIWEWRKMVIDGKMDKARKNGSIIILNEIGEEKVRWNFINGWPSKYDPSDLNAKGNEVAIETLEITHEGLERG